eukprot:351882-Chlamydomonas_euryale.AAC.3
MECGACRVRLGNQASCMQPACACMRMSWTGVVYVPGKGKGGMYMSGNGQGAVTGEPAYHSLPFPSSPFPFPHLPALLPSSPLS